MVLSTKNKKRRTINMQLKYESIEILLPCEPFCKAGDSYFDKNAGALVIPFAYCGEKEKCSCGEKYHIHTYRKIRLLAPPVGLHMKVYWEVTYSVYWCKDCDYYTTQVIPFRFGNTRCTTYLSKRICDDLDSNSRSIKDCASAFGLGWDTIKEIHKAFLEKVREKSPNPVEPKVCVVDEYSIEKGHRYATLVINAEDKEVLYQHKGNATEDFRPFFKEHKESWYKEIKGFAMDQNAQYNKVVKEEAPWATIVADYFHMLKNYNNDVIDKVRLRTARDYLRIGDKEQYMEWKAANRLFCKRLKGEEDIAEEAEWDAQFKLKSMMDSCHELDVCLHMRESLQRLYENCRDEKKMRSGWREWCEMAKTSGIDELGKFAEKKEKRSEEIINHAKMPITSGVIEGCMNKIKVIKRTAFGFRDFSYFFDRVWYAFLPKSKKDEAKRKVWETYSLDSSIISLQGIDQQKTG